MIQRVYAVYDLKVMAYLPPFFSQSPGGAIRAFADVVNEAGTQFNKHPGDYQLFEIGTFDGNSGELSGLNPQKLLGLGSDFVVDPVVRSWAGKSGGVVVAREENNNGS